MPQVNAYLIALTAALLLSLFGVDAQARDKLGVIDSKGHVIIPCKYIFAKYLGRGLYFMKEFQQSGASQIAGRGHIFDNNGQEIAVKIPARCTLDDVFLPPAFMRGNGFANVLPPETTFRIYSAAGAGLCKVDGSLLLEPKYLNVSPRDGRFFTVYKKGFYGSTIDFTFDSATGRRVAAPPGTIDDDSTCTSDGKPFEVLAHDGLPTLYGYLSQDGHVLIPARYIQAMPFSSNGLAVVLLNEQNYHYINRHGEVVSPPYKWAGDFQNGLAIVTTKDDKTGQINNQFKYVLPPVYSDLREITKDIYFAKKIGETSPLAIKADGSVLFRFPESVTGISKVTDKLITCEVRTLEPYSVNLIDVDYSGKIVGAARKLTTNYILGAEGNPPPDRFFARAQNDTFAPETSKFAETGYGNFYLERFADFLHCNNVIGMPRSEIKRLLGNDIDSYYPLSAGGLCANAPRDHVEFEYKDDKVSGWRINDAPGWTDRTITRRSPLVRTQMEFAWPDYHSYTKNLYSVLRPKGHPRRITRDCTSTAR